MDLWPSAEETETSIVETTQPGMDGTQGAAGLWTRAADLSFEALTSVHTQARRLQHSRYVAFAPTLHHCLCNLSLKINYRRAQHNMTYLWCTTYLVFPLLSWVWDLVLFPATHRDPAWHNFHKPVLSHILFVFLPIPIKVMTCGLSQKIHKAYIIHSFIHSVFIESGLCTRIYARWPGYSKGQTSTVSSLLEGEHDRNK